MRTVTTIFGSVELDGLDRVAGIDRPLEGLWANNLDDVRNLHHVDERRHAWRNILGARGRGRNDGLIAGREVDDERRQRLRKAVLVTRIVGDQHFRHTLKFGGRLRGSADIGARDENVDRALELDGRGQRTRGRIVQFAAGDFRQKKSRHCQITPTSSCSLATSSATDFTLTPDLRPGGSTVFSTLSRGETSTP